MASALVVLLAVLLTAFWALKRGGSGGEEPAGARVFLSDGITVVRVSGPPREKGRALGRALAERIKGELARALPEEGVRAFAVETCGERLAPFLPPAIREEIEGLAQGAGISFEEALFLDTRYEIAAFDLAPGASDLPSEGAVGPGPEAACLLPTAAAEGLVVVIHEDEDPPLVLVARPGMAGGFLGIKGDVAGAMRPMKAEAPPSLHGLVWTLLFRRLLEKAPEAPLADDGTGPLSVALALPGGRATTLSLSVAGAAIRDAAGRQSVTTDEPVASRPPGELPRLERSPAAEARIAEDAARVLTGALPLGTVRVRLRGGASGTLAIEGAERPRTISLRAR
ncbi:MAG TPA: hypothetical protein VFY93_09735 [Planctomycetota bacterium]|nr:hypothetical protein [Planctomycetota bacterium]